MAKNESSNGSIGTELEELKAGRSTFAQFVARTRVQWEKLARSTMQRWVTSDALELEDVVQEMLFAASKAVGSWDPERGVRLGTYVVWNAVSRATRAIHRDRGVDLHRPDRSPSNTAVTFSALEGRRSRRQYGMGEVGAGLLRDCRESSQAVAERVMEVLAHTLHEQEREVIEALMRGDSFELAGCAAGYVDRPARRAMAVAAAVASRVNAA